MENDRKVASHDEISTRNTNNTSRSTSSIPIPIPGTVPAPADGVVQEGHDRDGLVEEDTCSKSSSLVSRVGMMLSPGNYKRGPLRHISSLTPQDYGSGGDSEEEEDDHNNALQYVDLEEEIPNGNSNLEDSSMKQLNDCRPRTPNYNDYNVHDDYDTRELHVEGPELIPVECTRQDDDTLSPPRNRRPKPKKMLEQAFCIDEQSFQNVKQHTRRLFAKHHKKDRRGKSGFNSPKKGKKSGKNRMSSTNDLTASSSNTDDFCLKQGSAKKINAAHMGMSHEEVVSDVSDIDPDPEETARYRPGKGIARRAIVQHINNIPQVVKCVQKYASNAYSEVHQIMEDNAKYRASFSPCSSSSSFASVSKSSLRTEDRIPNPHFGIPHLGLERHSSNLIDVEKVSTEFVEQSYSGFMEENYGVLKDATHARSSSNDSLVEEAVEMPPVSVKDRVKAFEVQNALESSLAAGQQGPSTPRIKGRKMSTEEKRGPPQGLFKQLQPPKLNDTLKVVFLSAPHIEFSKTSVVHSLTTTKKKRRLSENSIDMNAYTWEPEGDLNGDMLMLGYGSQKPKFRLFDLKGGNLESGSHHSMQSLFFSPDSLYIIVWDLAENNKLLHEDHDSDTDSIDDSIDELEQVERLEKLKSKRNIIDRDINENILYWLDVIAELNFPGCVIMPVAVHSGLMDAEEAKERCEMLKERLESHRKRYHSSSSVPKIAYGSKDAVPIVPLREDGMVGDGGIDGLRRAILDVSSIDNVTKASAFRHHFKPMSPMILSAQDAISVFRSKDRKVVRFDDIFLEISKRPPIVDDFSKDLVRQAISFLSSTGDILYFGDQVSHCSKGQYLKKFVVLKPKWMSAAIDAAISSKNIKSFRDHDLSFKSAGTIKKCFENMCIDKKEALQMWEQSLYLCQQSKLIGDASGKDLSLFLQQVCEHAGIFVTVGYDKTTSLYLLPRIIAEPIGVGCPWSFKTTLSYKTVLCHSWLIREILPITFMDEIIATVVTELNDLAEKNQRDSSMGLFVQQVFCYKTSVYAKIAEPVITDDGEDKYWTNEIYVRLANAGSSNCVGANGMRDTDQKLTICGKGFGGNNGEKIWKFGYEVIRTSLERVISKWTKRKGEIVREIACPDCLLTKDPNDASLWFEDDILKHGDEMVLCKNPGNVHRVNPKLLRGQFLCDDDDDQSVGTVQTAYSAISHFTAYSAISHFTAMSHHGDRTPSISIEDVLPSIVLVGLWDTQLHTITYTGSGFIACKKRGLVITAGHVFYELQSSAEVGKIFHGIKDALAVIGVLDDTKRNAVFTYTAVVEQHDLEKVDACVLRITSKFEKPVSAHDCKLPFPQPTIYPFQCRTEGLQQLDLQDKFELESPVRIIGYNQEGEGLVREGGSIDHNPCFAAGHVVKFCDHSHHGDLRRNDGKLYFSPQSEIVVCCKNKHGHSGGPAINEKGEVIGIVNRSDPNEDDRCYLAPANILYQLLRKAKKTRNTRVRFNSRA